MAVIVIDCGHSAAGSDRGARCADGRMENDLNQAVAKRLSELLSDAGHKVVQIGNDGSDVVSRGAVGAKNGCELMISVHHNAYGEGANGTTVFKSVFADAEAPRASRAAKLILDGICAAIGTRPRNGGVPATRWNSTHSADYYGVIRGNTEHNTLIVEALFCDNADDLARWDPDAIARAIANAVCAEFGGSVPAPGPAPTPTPEGGFDVKVYKNGSTIEPVYQTTADCKSKTGKIGYLDKYEVCDCCAVIDGCYLVAYNVGKTAVKKCGFVAYHGGVK